MLDENNGLFELVVYWDKRNPISYMNHLQCSTFCQLDPNIPKNPKFWILSPGPMFGRRWLPISQVCNHDLGGNDTPDIQYWIQSLADFPNYKGRMQIRRCQPLTRFIASGHKRLMWTIRSHIHLGGTPSSTTLLIQLKNYTTLGRTSTSLMANCSPSKPLKSSQKQQTHISCK